MGGWRIELLGWLRAVQGDQVISRFRTQKVAALFAYLTYFQHRSHPREALVELLWPEADPKAGRDRLKTTLSSLRRQLEPSGIPPGAVLLADHTTVRLNPVACTTDVAAFEAALQAAARSPSDTVRTLRLEEAVERYQGELLPGFFEEWILPERQRLAEAHLQALRQLVRLQERQGDLPAALQWAHQAVAADPLHEEGHQDLIRLLAAVGRPAGALRQYREWERLAETAAGVEPTAALRSLARELEAAVAATEEGKWRRPGAGASRPPFAAVYPVSLDSVSVPSGHLPPRTDRFYGREAELAGLEQIMGERPPHRLVALTGPGGSGKTRLAIEAAARLQAAFEGRVWFVPLLDLASPRQIMEKVRDTLGLPRSPTVEPMDQVVGFLTSPRSARDRPGMVPPGSLLLLDNFEHLVGEGAAIIETLRERVETLVLLVTSRQRLGLPGEREFPVLPLPVPRLQSPASGIEAAPAPCETHDPKPETLTQCPSVQLFVDRAQAVRPDFQVTPRNAAAIARLCQRLEGLPLALELAAARAGVLTPAQMLARLEQRFEWLTSHHRAVDPRHSSLRATLDWSYRLLSPELQRFFARLSVFRGGWTLEAAEAVCGARVQGSGLRAQGSGEGGPVFAPTLSPEPLSPEPPSALEYLEQLRESSLILAEDQDGAMRYRLLETLREYGREQLSPEEQAAVADRHLNYYMALAEQAEFLLRGPEQEAWYARLEMEHDNLRAALDWARATDTAEAGLRLGGALGQFWSNQGHLREGHDRLITLLSLQGAAARTTDRAKALASAGLLAAWLGDLRAARGLLEESLSIQRERDDQLGIAWSLDYLGIVANNEANFKIARALHQESLAIRRRLGGPWELAQSLNCLGLTVLRDGDLEKARSLYEEGLAIRRALGDRRGTAWSLNLLAYVVLRQGEVERARRLYEESLSTWRRLGNKLGTAWSLNGLGQVAQQRGHHREAGTFFEGSLALRRELGDRGGVAECLEGLAQAVSGQEQPERAVRLFGAAHALRQALGFPLPSREQPPRKEQLAALRTALGEAAYSAAWEGGQAMTWEQASTAALAPAAPPDWAPVRQIPPPPEPPPPVRPPLPCGDLTPQEWERIAPLLPAPAPRRGRPFQDHRRTLNGILWKLRTGAPWRDLPERYGSWHTCHDRYRRWRQDGLWDRVVAALPATTAPADS